MDCADSTYGACRPMATLLRSRCFASLGAGAQFGAAGALIRQRLCSIHYHRWLRHGVPLDEALIAPAGSPMAFLDRAVKCRSKDCLYWPFHRRDGYARISHHHRLGQNVCRIICERIHGPPPTTKHEAAHSCGCGHLGCVNGGHLRWATPGENGADKTTHRRVRRGSKHHLARLTERQVREIRSLVGRMLQTEIAARFGVSADTISAIVTGRSWSWLK